MMNWLDRIALALSVFAASIQLLLSLSVNLPSQLGPISLVVLVSSIVYTILRTVFFNTQSSHNEASTSQSNNLAISNSSPAEQAYSYFASRYGVGYDSIQILWSISSDGSAILQRIVEVEAFAKTEKLDTYLLIPEKSESRTIDVALVESLSANWTVTLADIREELGRVSALINISPPLKKGEKIRFRMVEKLPVGLYAINLTGQELSKRESAHDYSGWNINRPTRKVSLQVEFPEKIKPEVFSSEVRYATTSGFPSSRSHYEESQRFSPLLTLSIRPKQDVFTLRLDVDYPMIGLIYILQWDPPQHQVDTP